MRTSRYAETRQKACQSCVAAKAKCDRKPGCCSRCSARGLACAYPRRQPGGTDKSQSSGITSPSTHTFTGGSPDKSSLGLSATRGTPSLAENVALIEEGDLVCPINADSISIRWMNAYVPTSADQATKTYLPSTILFLRHMLKSYAGMAIRGKLPPFVHPAQFVSSSNSQNERASSDAIVVCLSLAGACEAGKNASGSPATTAVKSEMDRLYDLMKHKHQGAIATAGASVDYLASLVIFQSYLLYALLLFFQLEQQADPYLRQAIVALQEIACMSAQHGLVCNPSRPTSSPNSIPSWMAWIVAEAKRRTLYTMYLFDSVLSAHDGLPTYMGVELRGLPASSSKTLWQAQLAEDWKQAYTEHNKIWHMDENDKYLCIDELWAAPAGMDSTSLARRRRRVDRWLEGVDEYGVMIYTVTSCTHGG